MTQKTNWDAIPQEIKRLRQWVCWRYEDVDGKKTKVPHKTNGRKASSDNPRTWDTFAVCVAAARKPANKLDGVGIVCANGLAGVDLDHCLDDGKPSDIALRIVITMNTYTEVTPSGEGLRCLCWGKLPKGGRKSTQHQIEMYDAGRYFTVTGNHFAGTPHTLEHRDDELARVHAEIFPATPRTDAPPKPKSSTVNLDDAAIIAKAQGAKNGGEFSWLWNGDSSSHNNDASAADMALVSHLAFWCGGDAIKIDRLFRQSGLYRDKWDRRHSGDGRTYGQMTIQKALADAREFYMPSHNGNGHGNGNGKGPHPDGATKEKIEVVPTLAEQTGQYVVRDGRICRRKCNADVAQIVPLCNFTAHIVEQVAHDDGAEVKRLIVVEGTHASGHAFSPAHVESKRFFEMSWLGDHWGADAIIEAGAGAQDHLRAAIQYLSPKITSRHVYAHTGWREIEGKRVFLTQAGAVGGAPVAVELDKELERYALPTTPRDVREAMRASLRFLDVAPKRVTFPLWASMFLAPLSEIVPPRFMLWVYGATGAFKSTLTALALSHFGDFTQDDLAQWNSTANAIERALFCAKDVPFTLDDFAPQSDELSARKLEKAAAHLVRDVGNRAGRSRLNADLSLRTVYRPRGLAISTGEQLPDGQSLGARVVTVEIDRGDVDVARLSAAQDARELYPHAMAGYVLWIADQWDHLAETLPVNFRELRTKARRDDQHARVPDALATLYIGLDLGLAYAVHIGALGEKDATKLRDEGWCELLGIADRQQSNIESEKPTRRFLTVLGELITQGRAQLVSTDTPNDRGEGEFLGWFDAENIYLLPAAAYHCVAKFEREQGRFFGAKDTSLRKALAEEGLMNIGDALHLTTEKRIGGKKVRTLALVRSKAEKFTGSIEKPATPATV